MRWENGDIENMRADKIAKLAKALNTTPVYLMGWTDEKEIMDLGNNAKDDLTSKEQELLEAFRRLLPEMQNFILESVKNLTSVKKLTLDKSE